MHEKGTFKWHTWTVKINIYGVLFLTTPKGIDLEAYV